MDWSYGITTTPGRPADYLKRTVKSLASAGFDSPRLFVDGEGDYGTFELPATFRVPKISPWGNWILALWELYLRQPNAKRYALFQDDMVTYRNLRSYLEARRWPGKGYLNLFTFPPPRQIELPDEIGWHHSNQLGRGAVALVFNLDGVRALLTSQYARNKCGDSTPRRAVQSIDGGVFHSMRNAGYCEYVHNPSLVEHIGAVSSIGNQKWECAATFRGEEFNAMELMKC